MPLSATYIQDVENRFSQASATLTDVLKHALASAPELTDEQSRLWLEEGVGLATHSLRSWEAAGDYLHAAPLLITVLDETAFKAWVAGGTALAELASAIASAYFRASPQVVPQLAGPQVGEWASLGEKLYKATWKSISLSSEFFALSPQLLSKLSLSELSRLGRVLEGVSDRSADLAAACLEAAPHVVENLEPVEVAAFLDFAGAISDSAWPEASLYFQRGPDLLRGVESGQRARYLELATRVARRLGRQAYLLFAEGSAALREVRGVRPRPADRAGRAPRQYVTDGGDGVHQVDTAADDATAPGRDRGVARSRHGDPQADAGGRRGVLPPRVRQGGGDDPRAVGPGGPAARLRAAASLRQGADRHQHLSAAGVGAAREGHRLGQRARAVDGGHQRLPAGLHRALRDEGRQLQRVQGVRNASDGAPRVRQLRLQLPRRGHGPATQAPRGRGQGAEAKGWSPRQPGSRTWSASSTSSRSARLPPTCSR